MADDNNSRYRLNAPAGGGSASAGSNDPLAELARLIGKDDLFSDFGRAQRPASQADDSMLRADAVPRYEEPRYEEPRYEEPRYEEPRHEAAYPSHHEDPPMGWDRESDPQPLSLPPLPRLSRSNASRYEPDHADSDTRYDSGGYQPELPRFFDPQRNSSDTDHYADAPPPFYPGEPDAGAMPSDRDDEFYNDAPRGGDRRKGLATVAAVLGLAVLGTAGAFAYRSFAGGAGSSSAPPPVIRASGEPSKVAPPPTTAAADQNKFSYDRFSDRGKNEQVVAREEKPVDAAELARNTPRTVFPGAPVPSSSARQNAGTTASANPPSAIGQPKRVRTVPIRPDQADIAANMPAESTQAVPSRETDAALSAPSNVAPPEQPSPPAAAPRQNAQRTPPRVASRPTTPAPARGDNAPLSLSPDNQPSPPAAAARDASPRAQAPTRVASIPAAGSAGGYLVQVSSQRSEADAQSSYRSIQSRYSSVLAGQPHVIRQANLGSKGVYYRAMVGPFSSREDAVRLCSNLKQAGGDCVVQH